MCAGWVLGRHSGGLLLLRWRGRRWRWEAAAAPRTGCWTARSLRAQSCVRSLLAQAIEEQLGVQTAFREQGAKLQALYDKKQRTEYEMAKRWVSGLWRLSGGRCCFCVQHGRWAAVAVVALATWHVGVAWGFAWRVCWQPWHLFATSNSSLASLPPHPTHPQRDGDQAAAGLEGHSGQPG